MKKANRVLSSIRDSWLQAQQGRVPSRFRKVGRTKTANRSDRAWFGAYPRVWCRREDLNLHGAFSPTRSLAWRVCQFRHSDKSGCKKNSVQDERQQKSAGTEQNSGDDRQPVQVALSQR